MKDDSKSLGSVIVPNIAKDLWTLSTGAKMNLSLIKN